MYPRNALEGLKECTFALVWITGGKAPMSPYSREVISETYYPCVFVRSLVETYLASKAQKSR